jgi:hypothetical protein
MTCQHSSDLRTTTMSLPIAPKTRKLAAPLLSLALLAASTGIEAKGCLKGAAVGAVAGHVAGHHAVVGAAAGCVIGHHIAKKKEREQKKERKSTQQNAPAGTV